MCLEAQALDEATRVDSTVSFSVRLSISWREAGAGQNSICGSGRLCEYTTAKHQTIRLTDSSLISKDNSLAIAMLRAADLGQSQVYSGFATGRCQRSNQVSVS